MKSKFKPIYVYFLKGSILLAVISIIAAVAIAGILKWSEGRIFSEGIFTDLSTLWFYLSILALAFLALRYSWTCRRIKRNVSQLAKHLDIDVGIVATGMYQYGMIDWMSKTFPLIKKEEFLKRYDDIERRKHGK